MTTSTPLIIHHSPQDRHSPVRRQRNVISALRQFARSLDDVGRHDEAEHRRNQANAIEMRGHK